MIYQKTFDLGKAGEQYLAECLRSGNSLSSYLANTTDLTKGHAWTLLPSNTPVTKLAAFAHGGFTKASKATDHIVQAIQKFLAGRNDAIVIIEDATLRRGDRYLDNTANKILLYGDEVYYILQAGAKTDEINLAVTDAGQNQRFVGIMTTTSQSRDVLAIPREGTSGLLDELARNTQMIFVGAYDNEGYLIWGRDPVPSDWRLQGQERYLKGVELCWATYKPYREGWDHDHCSFCWRKFAVQGGDFTEGYTTKNRYHWVCKDCYGDFKGMFDWKIISCGEDST